MNIKFLIDENLSDELAKLANSRKYQGTAHVNWRRLLAKSDQKVLVPYAIEHDFTEVTKDAGFEDHYSDSNLVADLHAGLISMKIGDADIVQQIDYFGEVLDYIESQKIDMINILIEFDNTLEPPISHRVFP